jgi:predicted metal-dependent hydrolase
VLIAYVISPSAFVAALPVLTHKIRERPKSMPLIVRYPRIDYRNIPAHWTHNIAFAQDRNATSLVPAPVEPWLIRILQSAVQQLGDRDASLREEVAAFIGQESQHFRQHRQFNKAMAAKGYPKLVELEQDLANDLEEFARTRSLKFLMAYADGFESMGAVAGGVWFEHSDAMLEGADPNATALWKWHMAEEFEHREVCFKFYHALFGRGLFKAIVNGYFYRVYGLVFAMRHLSRHIARIRAYLLEVDKAGMDAGQLRKLEQDTREFEAFQKRHFLPQLLKNFLPWYDPGRKPVPRGLPEYLKRFETGGDMARQPSL